MTAEPVFSRSYECPVCKARLGSYDLEEGRPPLVAKHNTERTEYNRDPYGASFIRTIRTPCPMSGEPIPVEFPW